jgi:predicted aspartyl protease
MDTLAITVKAERLLDRIITPVSVQQAKEYSVNQGIEMNSFDVRAMWDTGSKLTCISTDLVRYFGLAPVDTLKLTSIHGTKKANVYLIDIILPDNITIANVAAAEIDAGGEFDILIGMNIISLGDFAITNDNGKTIMSFRLPTANNPIDFSLME